MRAFLFGIFITMGLVLNGCREDKLPATQVRFKNIMVDHYEFPYGLMFGDAIYSGSLGYNESTPHYETKPGIFSVPERRPFSCPPPIIRGFTFTPFLTYREPTPLGP